MLHSNNVLNMCQKCEHFSIYFSHTKAYFWVLSIFQMFDKYWSNLAKHIRHILLR